MANSVVLTAGMAEILERSLGLVPNGTLYVAVGTSSSAANSSQVSLGSEIARVLASASIVAGNKATIKGFFTTAQANSSISEAGLVTKSTEGVLIERGIEVPSLVKDTTREMIVEKVITLVPIT